MSNIKFKNGHTSAIADNQSQKQLNEPLIERKFNIKASVGTPPETESFSMYSRS